jgi:hypothetical protein
MEEEATVEAEMVAVVTEVVTAAEETAAAIRVEAMEAAILAQARIPAQMREATEAILTAAAAAAVMIQVPKVEVTASPLLHTFHLHRSSKFLPVLCM